MKADRLLNKMDSSLIPSVRRNEFAFRTIIFLSALAILVLLLAMALSLIFHCIPTLKAFGLAFLYGKTWDPVSGTFGTLTFFVGTLITSFLALMMSLPFSMAISIYIGEYFTRGFFSSFLKNVTELIAGIPSIIYGFWALFILVPIIRDVQIKLGLFPFGVGIFTAALILAVMIIPYSASIGQEVIALVPSDIKEAAYALGATQQEVITKVILPHARSGMFAGVMLSLGRALGETMAVTMVIGNSNRFPDSLFSPGNTMASVIANEFTEATSELYVSALIEVALVLFVVTLVINIIGKYIIKQMSFER